MVNIKFHPEVSHTLCGTCVCVTHIN